MRYLPVCSRFRFYIHLPVEVAEMEDQGQGQGQEGSYNKVADLDNRLAFHFHLFHKVVEPALKDHTYGLVHSR